MNFSSGWKTQNAVLLLFEINVILTNEKKKGEKTYIEELAFNFIFCSLSRKQLSYVHPTHQLTQSLDINLDN